MPNDPLRPPNPSARLAGLMFIILGFLALLLGLCLLGFGAALPTLAVDPEVKRKLDDLRRLTSSDLRILFYVTGGLFAAYGVAAVSVGPFIRSAFRIAIILGLLLAGGVVLLSGLNAIAALIGGEVIDVVVPAGMVAVHVWLIKLQIAALRNAPATVAPAFHAPSPYQPMQAYYLPPVPPVRPI